MARVKIITAKEAAEMIPDNGNLCVNGFKMTNAAEELFMAVEDRFLKTGHPRNVKLMFTGSVGDHNKRGINHFAHEGLLREVLGAHYASTRTLTPLIKENKIKAYNLPQGVLVHIYRAQGAGEPGLISHVGLNTFADPDLDGGKLNEISDEDYVQKIHLNGKPYLFYKSPGKIDYAFVRGTEADEDGNISMRKEALKMDTIPVALATKNTGGKVVVQVERIVRRGTIDPKDVALPRNMVDYVVIRQDPKNHMHTQDTVFNEDFYRADGFYQKPKTVIPLNARKIIARRAAMLLNKKDYVLNFGGGISDMVGVILEEENLIKEFVQTAESGITGGIAQSGGDFGVARFPEALVDTSYQFDYYQGGGVDCAFLGLAQCDEHGNINVSKFGNSFVSGSGGFTDIAQNAKKVVFCGTFHIKGSEYKIGDGRLQILEEGTGSKFLKDVEQITYSGDYAKGVGQEAYMVTERALFRLTSSGIELLEYAPGLDPEKDILAHMDFRPIISKVLHPMVSAIFREEPTGFTLN